MSNKSRRLAELIQPFLGRSRDARYLAYFDLFNREKFFEAHDVLEDLWLSNRGSPNSDFYKGLIQLAGGFVHLQKERLRPAAAVLKLAISNLDSYAPEHEGLDVERVLLLAREKVGELEKEGFQDNPLNDGNAPKLALLQSVAGDVTTAST